MKFDHKLLKVQAHFRVPRIGLMVVHFFPLPKSGEKIDYYSTQAKVIDPHKKEKVHKMDISCCHIHTLDPKVSIEERSKLTLLFPDASEEQIPIGSAIFVTKEDFKRITGKNA